MVTPETVGRARMVIGTCMSLVSLCSTWPSHPHFPGHLVLDLARRVTGQHRGQRTHVLQSLVWDEGTDCHMWPEAFS